MKKVGEAVFATFDAARKSRTLPMQHLLDEGILSYRMQVKKKKKGKVKDFERYRRLFVRSLASLPPAPRPHYTRQFLDSLLE